MVGRTCRARLAGQVLAGRAEAVSDPVEARSILAELVASQPGYARLARLLVGPEGPDLDRAVGEGRVGIIVQLDAPAG